MRKSLLFLLNTLLAAATLCVVSCGIDDVDAEDGAINSNSTTRRAPSSKVSKA